MIFVLVLGVICTLRNAVRESAGIFVSGHYLALINRAGCLHGRILTLKENGEHFCNLVCYFFSLDVGLDGKI